MPIVSDVPPNDHLTKPEVATPRQRWTLVAIRYVPITLDPGTPEPISQDALRELWDDYASDVVDPRSVYFYLIPGHDPQYRHLHEEDL